MREDYEGQGLERFARTVGALAVIGAVSVLGWGLYALWRALT
jgi:hypothetical protein